MTTPTRTTTRAHVLVFLVIAVSICCLDQAESATSHESSAPAVDCSTLILNMADCLSFVTNGSTSSKPEGACCAGLKTVLKVDSWCLCEAFRTSTQLGVFLNVTKALTLPDACKVSAPEATNCAATAETPAGAPALSPEVSRSSTGGGAPPSRTVTENDVPNSTSSPRSSGADSGSGSSLGSSSPYVSAGLTLATGLAVVSFLSF